MLSRNEKALRATLVLLALLGCVPLGRAQQTAKINTEYVMTLYAPLDAPQVMDNNLFVYNVLPGGTVTGKVNGKLLPPCGDWLRLMPSGNYRLDVRCSIQTDDEQLIFVEYSGVVKPTKETNAKYEKGEDEIKADEQYFLTAPTFRTSSPKYAWLNDAQFIGKAIGVHGGKKSFVKYDWFIVR